MNIIEKIFGKKIKGTPCWVVSLKGKDKLLLPGMMFDEKDEAVTIVYHQINEPEQRFITRDQDYVFLVDGVPAYDHNSGYVFDNNLLKDKTLIDGVKVSSYYFHQVYDLNVGAGLAGALRDDLDGEHAIPWKTILIWAAVAIGAFVLWKSGIVQSLLSTVSGSI